MITTKDIRRIAEAYYRQWLRDIAGGNPAYEPLTIKRTGDQKKTDERWEALSEIVHQSKEKIGYGYRIELEAPAPSSKNKQSRLRAIVFDTEADLLQFIQKTTELEQFKHDFAQIAGIRELQPWCVAHVREVLQYARQSVTIYDLREFGFLWLLVTRSCFIFSYSWLFWEGAVFRWDKVYRDLLCSVSFRGSNARYGLPITDVEAFISLRVIEIPFPSSYAG